MKKNKNFGIRLSEAIANKKITQGELARRMGTSPSLVSRWRNEEVLPGSANYKKLASILNVSMEWLMTGKQSASNSVIKTLNNTITENTEDEDMYRLKFEEAQARIIELQDQIALLQKNIIESQTQKKARATKKAQ